MDNLNAFAEAQKADELRTKISQYAASAVNYGNVDRDWVNQRLNRMGAPLVTGAATYKISKDVIGQYGTTVQANSRTEALAKFGLFVDQVAADGHYRGQGSSHGAGIFNLTFSDADPVFVSGPADIEPEPGTEPGYDALVTAIRTMLADGVIEQGWGWGYAQSALADMDLPSLPALTGRTVTVPVTGTASVYVQVFEGADAEDVQRAASASMARSGAVPVKPEEVGMVIAPRTGGDMGLTIVDDDSDE